MTRFFSRTMAWVLGIFFPLVEMWRRSAELGQLGRWPAILDDFLMGALLLAGAFSSRRRAQDGQTLLAAAWGFACAMMYGSFFGQLGKLQQADPSGFPAECVVAVKALLLALCIAGLVSTLRFKPDRAR